MIAVCIILSAPCCLLCLSDMVPKTLVKAA